MMNVSNYPINQKGIHSPTERYSWAAYKLFVLLSSLIGDTLILYASFRRDAFKLNDFIVSVLQHIAFSDLLLAALRAFPTAIALLNNSWVLGNAMCYTSFYISYWAYPIGNTLIAVMSTCKCILLKFPLKASHWTRKRGHLVCTSIWGLFLSIGPLPLIVIKRDDVQYEYVSYDCEYGFNAEAFQKSNKLIYYIIGLIVQFLPPCIIIGTTIPTLNYLINARKYAKRVQGSIPWQGAMTVALTAVVYCVSNVPLLAYFTGRVLGIVRLTSSSSLHFFNVAKFLMEINVMANFYIYALTIRSFRRFLLSEFYTVVSSTRWDSRTRTSEGKVQCEFLIACPGKIYFLTVFRSQISREILC